jgi:hypothetical protein
MVTDDSVDMDERHGLSDVKACIEQRAYDAESPGASDKCQ